MATNNGDNGTLNYGGRRGPVNCTVNDPAMQKEIEAQRRRSEVGSRVNVDPAIGPGTTNLLEHTIVEGAWNNGVDVPKRTKTVTVRTNN